MTSNLAAAQIQRAADEDTDSDILNAEVMEEVRAFFSARIHKPHR